MPTSKHERTVTTKSMTGLKNGSNSEQKDDNEPQKREWQENEKQIKERGRQIVKINCNLQRNKKQKTK